ncbi:MAG: protein-glutamate O-methyltransferase CheR [Gemmatimonadota bacterium]
MSGGPAAALPPIGDHGLEALLAYVRRTSGLSLELYRQRGLRRRLDVRVRVNRLEGCGDYLRLLRSDAGERECVTRSLTIPVSRFFRNRESFLALERWVLPLLARGARGRPVRAWSAGAAGGEEPYTLAMSWERSTGGIAGPPPLELLATDVDRVSLGRARTGVYDAAALTEVAPRERARWFAPEGDRYRVVERVRAAVRFRRADLAAAPRPRSQDLILCRNVLIYFDRPLQESLTRAFYDALRPGGFLMLGRVEMPCGPARRLFEPVDVRERLFRKPLGVDRS